MAQQPTADSVLVETVTAVQQHGGVAQAARALGLPYGTVQSRHRLALLRGITPGTVAAMADVETRPVSLPFEREWAVWQKTLGMVKDRYAGPARPRATTGRLRIVAAGDFHIPFHDREALAQLITREKDADVLVIGGDFGDAHSASVFTKYDHVSFEEEHAAKAAVLQTLSETFPVVRFLRGSNHSDRYEKRLREHLDRDLIAAICSMTGGLLNPELALLRRFPNVEVASWTTPRSQTVGWLSVLGDVAFSHAEKYSRTPGAALRSVEEWLDDHSGPLGLPKLRCVVQFHTHACAWLPWRSDMLLVEPGCMCVVQGYQLQARIAGRPQRLGYVVLDLVDGAVDLGSVQIRWLDAARHSA